MKVDLRVAKNSQNVSYISIKEIGASLDFVLNVQIVDELELNGFGQVTSHFVRIELDSEEFEKSLI